ncbi:MAG TPA: MG2 domain-containing protein [Myxococcaceae bacterium]|nr:MG2 domain-containing protein [Myxococcaceae bacterium]
MRPVWMLAALLGALSACNCGGGADEKADDTSVTEVHTPGDASGEAATHSAPTIRPTLSLDGGGEFVPERITVELNASVLRPHYGLLPEGIRVSITPEVNGAWEQAGVSTLVFTAAEGFDFETEYTVRVESVETEAQGVLTPPSADAWTRTFRTPAFGVLRSSLRSFNAPERSAQVLVTFTGPVSPSEVDARAVWQLEGSAVSSGKPHADDPRTVVFSLRDSRLTEGRTLSLQLRSGVPSGDARAPRYETQIVLPKGKRLHVRAATLLENPSGFFVEVSCQDLNPDERPYQGWDGEVFQERYWGPKGCEIDAETARRYVKIEPAVNLSIAPSSRGFRLFGDFVQGSYTLRLEPGMVSTEGAQLFNAYDTRFTVGPRAPQLTLAGTGRYLPRSAWKSLAISHLNLSEAELVVRRIPPANLIYWLSDDNERVSERIGDVILRRKLALRGEEDKVSTTHVNLSDELSADTLGVLEVEVQHGNVRSASRLLLTDMSLVAKTMPASGDAPAQVWVWALGITSNELLAGVDVQLVRKSGKVVAECKTGGANGCIMEVKEDPLNPEAEGFALIARRGHDLTYLRYSDLETEIADSDVQGEAFSAAAPYRAAMWSDRGVYRPGDAAHLNALVRTREGVAPKAGMPTELQLVDPRGRVVKQQTLETNPAGLVGMEVRFEAFADTGVYSARLRIAEREVARYALNVEEFVPERMKVTLTASDAGALIGEAVPVEVAAEYLFGGSAEGSEAALTCQLEAGTFKPANHAEYSYGIWSNEGAKPVTLGRVTGKVGADGRIRLECPALTGAAGFRGPARLVANAAVSEAGSGRATQNEVRVPVHPERYYLGLQLNASKAEKGKPIGIKGVVVDWNGKKTQGVQEVQVEAFRMEASYGYWWDPEIDRERYSRRLRPVSEHRLTAKVVDGAFEARVTPSSESEQYMVRVTSGRTQTDVVIDGDGYRWYWGDQQVVDQTPRPQRATSIPLEVKGPAKVGEPVQVVAKLPYRGRVLFTAETDRILAAEWKSAEAGEVTWSFTPRSFKPNVYLSAFLVKDPHLESKESFLPDRAFGVTHAMLEPSAFVQTVKLTAPKEVRSNEVMEVELDLGPRETPTFATVAAVDEGILQLTRFRSPDPLSQIIVKRGLGVKTYETLGWTMLSMPQGNSRSTGGGEDMGAEGRVQPVKPVALYSGVVEVPKNGKAKIRFEVPQYRGRLRVMAVTADAKRVGRAEASVLVRDPITLQATLPRFLSAQDQIEIPVFLTNLSGKAQDVSVSLSAEALPVPGLDASAKQTSPLELLGAKQGSVRIENGKSATLVFQARALQSVGAARLTVKASGGGFTSEETLDVPFSPSGPRERQIHRIELADGVNDLKPYLSGWVPTTERSTVWVTANPYGQSFDHLKYLVRYPHGCAEQVTSTVRPMLFASTVMESVDPTALNGQVETFVRAGIKKVLAMQTPSGAFGYWPGATEAHPWATGYVTLMLLDAKDAGYEVPQDRIDDAIAFAEKAVSSTSSQMARTYGVDASAFLHYTLARAGKGQKAAIQKRIDLYDGKSLSGSEREELFLLKAALWLAGDRRYEKELKSPDLSPIGSDRWSGGSFYSDQRRRGLMLAILEDLFPGDKATEPLAMLVAQSLQAHQSGHYYTTQELGWSFTGLGKRLRERAAKFGKPELLADGRAIKAKPVAGVASSERTWALARAAEYPSLSVKLDKEGSGKVYAVLSSEGVRENGSWRLGGDGLSVKRTWRTLEGRTVDPTDAALNLADLLYVQIDVTNRTGERLENIALVDRLPAGWEIENPRLGRGTQPDWVNTSTQWQADYLSVRDDRLEMFGPIGRGQTVSAVYAVRATSSGVFTLPPVEVEAMYDPRIWAREAGGQVRINGPWADHLL